MIRQDVKKGLIIGLMHVPPFIYLYIVRPGDMPVLIVFVCISLAWIAYVVYLWESEIFYEKEDQNGT